MTSLSKESHSIFDDILSGLASNNTSGPKNNDGDRYLAREEWKAEVNPLKWWKVSSSLQIHCAWLTHSYETLRSMAITFQLFNV